MFGLSHLSYHFSHSLFLFVLKIDENKSGTLGSRQQIYLRTIVKQTILANWINVAGLIFAISSVGLSLIDPNRESVVLVMVRSQIMAFSIFVIITSIYLSFSMNYDAYHKICDCCHSKCYELCKYRASRRILKQNMQKDSEHGLKVMDKSSTTKSQTDAASNTGNLDLPHPMDISTNISTIIKLDGGRALMIESGFEIVEAPMTDNENDANDEDNASVENENDETTNLDLNELDEVLDDMETWRSTPL